MSTLEFIVQFKALHDRAKNGSLTAMERTRYKDLRAHFIRLIVASQALGHAGQTLRSGLRMAKMLKVEITPDKRDMQRLSTIDVSSGGFAVLISPGFPVGTAAAFTLYLPGASAGASTPMSGRCLVASSRAQASLFRVSFKFDALAPTMQEQLDIALIDAVLERFTKSG